MVRSIATLMKKLNTPATISATLGLFSMTLGLCMSGQGGAVSAADAEVARLDRAVLLRQADRCETILSANLMPFYLPGCLDTENGGFKESLRGGPCWSACGD